MLDVDISNRALVSNEGSALTAVSVLLMLDVDISLTKYDSACQLADNGFSPLDAGRRHKVRSCGR